MNNSECDRSRRDVPTTTFLRFLSFLGCLCCLTWAQTGKAEAANSTPDKPATEAPKHFLKQVLVAEGIQAAQAMSLDANAGFVVLAPSLSFLNAAELEKRLESGQNRPIDLPLLAAL